MNGSVPTKLALALLLSSCSLSLNTDRFVFDPLDSGVDSGVDSAVDSAVDGSVDSSPRDSGPIDGGRCVVNGDCSYPNGVGSCTLGLCELTGCVGAFDDCDGVSTNGCELNTSANIDNCGECGNSCVRDNAIGACVSSRCTITRCAAGFVDCDDSDLNGCEASLSDVLTCGGCGNQCDAGDACDGTASPPTCVMDCPDDTSLCGATCTNTRSDTQNCGGCDAACELSGVAEHTCVDSSCGIGLCESQRDSCDEEALTGCETNIGTNTSHCGECGVMCSTDDNIATASCAFDDGCGIMTCEPGFRDCNMMVGDGCESELATDEANCGSCGVMCDSGMCVEGVCNPVRTVSSGDVTTCALRANGEVHCLGANTFHQLGHADGIPRGTATPIGSSRRFLDLSVGNETVCGVDLGDGGLYCWGRGFEGQRGDGTLTGRAAEPVAVTSSDGTFGDEPFESVVVASGVTCLLEECTTSACGPRRSDSGCYNEGAVGCGRNAAGEVWCWGTNRFGEAGNGTTTRRQRAVHVSLGEAAQLVAGRHHMCALMAADGAVYCWGRNHQGQLGNGTTTNASIPVQVVTGGGPLLNVVELAAGGDATCASDASGALFCWGSDEDGQMRGDGSDVTEAAEIETGVSAFSVGEEHVLALDSEGWKAWGRNRFGEFGDGSLNPGRATIPVASNVSATADAVIAGVHTTCAIEEGRLQCWGDNRDGQIGRSDVVTQTTPVRVSDSTGPLSGFTDVAAGESTSCGIRDHDGVSGTPPIVVCWGRQTIFPGAEEALPGVAEAGSSTPAEVAGPTTPPSGLTVGRRAGCMIYTDFPRCWGDDHIAQLGRSQDRPAAFALRIPGWTDRAPGSARLDDITMGRFFGCGRLGSEVRCWGSNLAGQLGMGTTANFRRADESVNLQIGGSELSATYVRAGDRHACAIEDMGTVACWGDFYSGQGAALGRERAPVRLAHTANVISLGLGHDHTCVVEEATVGDGFGEVSCWGRNWAGQTGGIVGTDTRVARTIELSFGVPLIATQVVGGSGFTCAVDQASAVFCWGENDRGQLGDGTLNSNSVPQPVLGMTSVVKLDAGNSRGDTVCAVLSSGEVACWGANDSGRCGASETLFYTEPGSVLGLP